MLARTTRKKKRENLNTLHPNLKFTADISDSTINFLDLTIFKSPDYHNTGKLSTKVFTKPCDTFQLYHNYYYLSTLKDPLFFISLDHHQMTQTYIIIYQWNKNGGKLPVKNGKISKLSKIITKLICNYDQGRHFYIEVWCRIPFLLDISLMLKLTEEKTYVVFAHCSDTNPIPCIDIFL